MEFFVLFSVVFGLFFLFFTIRLMLLPPSYFSIVSLVDKEIGSGSGNLTQDPTYKPTNDG